MTPQNPEDAPALETPHLSTPENAIEAQHEDDSERSVGRERLTGTDLESHQTDGDDEDDVDEEEYEEEEQDDEDDEDDEDESFLDYLAAEELETDVRAFVAREIAAGFTPDHEIHETAVQHFSHTYDESEVRSAVDECLADEAADHRDRQAGWPPTTDCDRLTSAFQELRSRGILARENLGCCSTCGCSEIEDEITAARQAGDDRIRGFAFYHSQDVERVLSHGVLLLMYGTALKLDTVAADDAVGAIGNEIVTVLRRHGLNVEWDGQPEERIGVRLDWMRRRAEETDWS